MDTLTREIPVVHYHIIALRLLMRQVGLVLAKMANRLRWISADSVRKKNALAGLVVACVRHPFINSFIHSFIHLFIQLFDSIDELCVSNVRLTVVPRVLSWQNQLPWISGLSETQFHCHREIMQLAKE